MSIAPAEMPAGYRVTGYSVMVYDGTTPGFLLGPFKNRDDAQSTRDLIKSAAGLLAAVWPLFGLDELEQKNGN